MCTRFQVLLVLVIITVNIGAMNKQHAAQTSIGLPQVSSSSSMYSELSNVYQAELSQQNNTHSEDQATSVTSREVFSAEDRKKFFHACCPGVDLKTGMRAVIGEGDSQSLVDFEMIKHYIKSGMNVNQKWQNARGEYRSLLHWVCSLDNSEVCRLLLAAGATVQVKDSRGETPLHTACSEGCVEICRLLLDAGALVDAEGNDGKTPLHIVCRDIMTTVCEESYLEICRLLLDAGANVHVKDCYGETPLLIAGACMYNLKVLEIYKLLLAKGANINAKSNNGETALLKVCMFDAESNFDGFETQLKMCEFLLENGANVNDVGIGGRLPLYEASLSDKSHATCELFIAHGANVKAKIDNGETCLHGACRNAAFANCKILLEQGADPNARDNEGNTPLHFTGNAHTREIEGDWSRTREILIQYGADKNPLNNDGMKPEQFLATWRQRLARMRTEPNIEGLPVSDEVVISLHLPNLRSVSINRVYKPAVWDYAGDL
jgi:ankyrin repeat protein